MRDFKFFQKEQEQTRAREVFRRRFAESRLQQERQQQEVLNQEQVVTYFQQRQDEWWNETDVVLSMEEDNSLTQQRIELLEERIETLYNVIRNYERELNILTE